MKYPGSPEGWEEASRRAMEGFGVEEHWDHVPDLPLTCCAVI